MSERQAKVAAYSQQQKGAARRRTTIIGAVVVAVVVVLGLVAFLVSRSGSDKASGNGASSAVVDDSKQVVPAGVTGAVTTQTKPTQVADKTGIDGVLAWDTTGWPGSGTGPAGAIQHDHVSGPVKYAVLPPVGGPHNATWMNAGVYTKPIPSERAVHNLEHGAVWITYDPNLPAAQVKQLVAFVTKQSLIPEQGAGMSAGQANRYVDLSPWATSSLPSPIVISSWGYQLRVTSPTDPRLQKFVDTFRNSQTYSPEYGSPVDGIPVQTGGRPATDGGAVANPAGSAG